MVLNLRASWIAGPAMHWLDVCAVGERAGSNFDKRIAATLRDGFFCFSQLLCGLEVLLLQSQQLGVVPEESLLGVEKLVVQLGNDRRDLIEIANAQRGLTELLRCSNGTVQAGDHREIQGGLLRE